MRSRDKRSEARERAMSSSLRGDARLVMNDYVTVVQTRAAGQRLCVVPNDLRCLNDDRDLQYSLALARLPPYNSCEGVQVSYDDRSSIT